VGERQAKFRACAPKREKGQGGEGCLGDVDRRPGGGDGKIKNESLKQGGGGCIQGEARCKKKTEKKCGKVSQDVNTPEKG